MNLLPLNATRVFSTWPHFDPGLYIDHNCGFVRVGDAAWVVFCRNPLPPEPGRGSIWAVPVDRDLQPSARPVLLIDDGLDPRVLAHGDDILVFYSLVERDAAGQVCGSCVVLAEFMVRNCDWRQNAAWRLPKRPIEHGETEEALQGWEKNWVPFVTGARELALIYSHEPWDVITLDRSSAVPRLLGVHRTAAIGWDHGTIRGGTPPVRFDSDHLVTFFHAARTLGSRRVYGVGACVFQARPPYAPMLVTPDPLLLAPYHSGVERFGWKFAASVVFPLGVEPVETGYRLLCGRDDGEVAHFTVMHGELVERLAPANPVPRGTLHDYSGRSARLPLKRLLYVPDPIPGLPELPMIDFLRVLAGRGRTFVDVGAHIGFYTMGLAPGFERVIAFEPSRSQYSLLVRNRVLNDYRHVACENAALGAQAGEAVLTAPSREGGATPTAPHVAAGLPALDCHSVRVEALDERGLDDVDLLKIGVEGQEIPILRGARTTISTSRPVILVEVRDEPPRRRQVRAELDALGYGFEFVFPHAPELAICLPRERRHEYAWFV